MTAPPAVDAEHLRRWIGRRDIRDAVLASATAQALAATLDREAVPQAGETLPPLWHWAHFAPTARQSELGVDGHPRLGGFLPPIPLPRRMWAGGRLRFLHDLAIGDAVRRETLISDLTVKEGRQGPLIFLTLTHRIGGPRGLMIEEEQDIVYRAPAPGAPPPPPIVVAAEPAPDWREVLTPDPTLLFRYSALTFNAHRIHYDLPYARDEEGYAGLVVQGPLTATLLMERAVRWSRGRRPTHFAFRGLSPLLAGEPLTLNGRREGDRLRLWAEGPGGRLAMSAEADFGDTLS